MPVTLHAGLPSEDPVQALLYSGAESKPFPGGHFRSPADVERRLAHLDRRRPKPEAVQAFLHAENAFAPLSAPQRAHLEAAGSDRAVFIVTGQQPGLFGGPLLWYYKALTCAALARRETIRQGRPVIPIFWVAGDDSDLAECSFLELLEKRPASVPSVLSLPFPDPDRPIPVGARAVDQNSFGFLLDTLGKVWKKETVAASRACYPLGSTLADGFLCLAQSRLAEEGILFVNGFSPRLRALARPTLLKAAREWRKVETSLETGTASLRAAGIKPQVALRSGVVHAFVLKNGERHRLFAERLNGHDRFYLADQPQRDLSHELEFLDLSHDVFTRPLVAEAALPVLGHVLGPAELKYFAQMAQLFEETSGDMPLVQPRMTAMAAPASALEAFAARGLTMAQIARLKPSGLKARLSSEAWTSHPAAREMPAGPAEAWLPSLRPVHLKHFRDAGPLDRLEKSLKAAWKRYHVSLERLAYAARNHEDAELFAQLQWLGNGAGQDRHLNFHSLLDALGPQGMAELRHAADPVSTDLQVFTY
jgi:bacillithiol biosynthesis cysteine-adding enzyme BshC